MHLEQLNDWPKFCFFKEFMLIFLLFRVHMQKA